VAQTNAGTLALPERLDEVMVGYSPLVREKTVSTRVVLVGVVKAMLVLRERLWHPAPTTVRRMHRGECQLGVRLNERAWMFQSVKERPGNSKGNTGNKKFA